MASEPDFICLDKATQTTFDSQADDATQEKKGNSCTAHMIAPGKERYYLVKTKTRREERAFTVKPESEPGDFLLKEKEKEEDTRKHLEGRQVISSPSDKENLNEIRQTTDAAAAVTGQILLAVASLRDTDKNSIQAASAMLNSILKKDRNKLREKVPEIIDIIYFHLRAIQEPSAREVAIGAVCLLTEKHTEETITSLLRLSLLCDRHITQIWEALGQAKQPVRLQVLAKLLEVLKRKPCLTSELPGSDAKSKDNSSLLPLAATKALCIIFRDKKCKVPMNSYYVSVIIFLVIQLHYLMNCSDTEGGQEDILKTSNYISCTMEALKALVKREKTPQTCFTSLTGSWDLLSSPENYLEGVLLLARALVKHHRGLDYAVFTKVIPLLHHGDDKQKLTAMAFFTALLSSESTYTVLQKHYILGLLKNWQTDSSSTYRWLSLHGMGNVARHLQNKKELSTLILGILPSFHDTDEKVTLTAMEVISKIITHHNNYINMNIYVKIAKQLQPFLADGRSKICCAANKLFQDMLKNLDVKDKSTMQDQVLHSIVTLLLNLQDPHLAVAKSRRDSLKECKVFVGWSTNDNLDSWSMICKHLVKEHPGKLRSFLDQAQDYSQSPQMFSRTAATMFIDSILQQIESSPLQKSEVDFLRQAFSSFPSETHRPVPVVPEPEKVRRYCADLFRCSRYFPRSCI
ncbi:maestro heat-like repeat-containing protein family member 6 [Rhineura floridana]|uniref:maestro heat-like repeat-containing protein family member 6 n=1 Tax=Rhineura floridana TaxID=261503 RepID=UPI002AC870B3|nr:maestro heat-like repeat-containing protein family member 6 [Rhineura floridana]